MVSSFICAFPAYGERDGHKHLKDCPSTVAVLHDAYKAEMNAYEHYEKFADKALEENYPNVAYLFHALSVSEEIHADNYKAVLESEGEKVQAVHIDVLMKDTKANLHAAAKIEMEKIEKIYPGFLKKLETESYDNAIINCMYSWKSHQQHKDKINEILRYISMFSSAVVSRIEDLKLNFYVCRVCGSTLDVKPSEPCNICNKSMANYQRIDKPDRTGD